MLSFQIKRLDIFDCSGLFSKCKTHHRMWSQAFQFGGCSQIVEFRVRKVGSQPFLIDGQWQGRGLFVAHKDLVSCCSDDLAPFLIESPLFHFPLKFLKSRPSEERQQILECFQPISNLEEACPDPLSVRKSPFQLWIF